MFQPTSLFVTGTSFFLGYEVFISNQSRIYFWNAVKPPKNTSLINPHPPRMQAHAFLNSIFIPKIRSFEHKPWNINVHFL